MYKSIAGLSGRQSRLVVTSASGSIRCWKDSQLIWTREEALSEVRASVVVDLPERKVEETGSLLDHEGFVSRIIRHIKQLNVGRRDLAAELGRSLTCTTLHTVPA
jgi:hypothetical protein